MANSYNKKPDECIPAIESIPIIHLHGTLGPLPWQTSKAARIYNWDCSPAALRIAAANIKIIHEDIKDGRDKDFDKAKDLLQKADRILFMGFGYNATNLMRLGIASLPESKSFGTCVGLGQREKTVASSLSNGRIEFREGDCLHFVREFILW